MVDEMSNESLDIVIVVDDVRKCDDWEQNR